MKSSHASARWWKCSVIESQHWTPLWQSCDLHGTHLITVASRQCSHKWKVNTHTCILSLCFRGVRLCNLQGVISNAVSLAVAQIFSYKNRVGQSATVSKTRANLHPYHLPCKEQLGAAIHAGQTQQDRSTDSCGQLLSPVYVNRSGHACVSATVCTLQTSPGNLLSRPLSTAITTTTSLCLGLHPMFYLYAYLQSLRSGAHAKILSNLLQIHMSWIERVETDMWNIIYNITNINLSAQHQGDMSGGSGSLKSHLFRHGCAIKNGRNISLHWPGITSYGDGATCAVHQPLMMSKMSKKKGR